MLSKGKFVFLIILVLLVASGRTGAQADLQLSVLSPGEATNLRMSASSDGASACVFPSHQEVVYACFDYEDMQEEEWGIVVYKGEESDPLFQHTASYTGSGIACVEIPLAIASRSDRYITNLKSGPFPASTVHWFVRANTIGELTNLYVSETAGGPPVDSSVSGIVETYVAFRYSSMADGEVKVEAFSGDPCSGRARRFFSTVQWYTGDGMASVRVTPERVGPFEPGDYTFLVSKAGYVDQKVGWDVKYGVFLPSAMR